MSRNGSGVYSLPAGNPVVTGTAISSTWANNTLTDIANALTGSLSSDGQTPLTGNLNFASTFKPINMVDPTNLQDGVTKNYLLNIDYSATGTKKFTNITYTGTLTGGTGVINLGSGQIYKDASGNLGLGTTNPLYTLDIRTASNNGLRVTDGTYSGTFVASSLGGMAITTSGAYPLLTYVNGATRTVTDSNGHFIFNPLSGIAPMAGGGPFIQASNNVQYGQFIAGQTSSLYWNFGRDNVTTGRFIFGWLGTQVASIDNTTGVYTAVSDGRLKKNITPIHYGLKEILALNPVMYNMKTEDDTKKKHIGLIAQEVKLVINELVEDIDESKQNYGLAPQEIVPILIKAIQELNARIVILESKK